jgi:hypothetical protein
MADYSKVVKKRLDTIINKMASCPEHFVKNPGKDFTRQRKLNFESLLRIMLSMGGKSIYSELLEYYNFDVDTVSSSAFVQQRSKILPHAFEYLLNEFNKTFTNYRTYAGYRILAADGSNLSIAHNPQDTQTYVYQGTNTKGHNLMHLNVLYDLCNKLYVDACIQPGNQLNEFKALTDMVKRSEISNNVIVIADRGYESYNIFSHIENKGWKYVIRVKDISSNGILSGLKLPNEDVFDIEHELLLTRRQTKEIKAHPEYYKFMPSVQKFDFLPVGDKNFYPIKFRVVRIKITENSFETLITNLKASEFPLEKLKSLYHMRWGVETSFRELKYSIGMVNFHAKKTEYIIQEVFARITMYNFCERITIHVVITQKNTVLKYQVNFTIAIQVCRRFFKTRNNASPIDVEALIKKNMLPVRENRQAPRKIRFQTAVSFIYRVG